MTTPIQPQTPAPKKCPLCGAYFEKHGHGLMPDPARPCPNMTREELEAKVMQYHAAWREKCDHEHNTIVRAQKQALLWQGKFTIVKHENNQLRKKVAVLSDKLDSWVLRASDAALAHNELQEVTAGLLRQLSETRDKLAAASEALNPEDR